jgi:hypothetical protein
MKIDLTRIAIASAIALSLSATLSAQVGAVTAPTLNGGMITIPVVLQPGLGDIAKAGPGVIYADPAITMLPWEGQQFILGHEAGHEVGILNEAQADAYSARVLRMAGFTPQQMQIVYATMARALSPVGDWSHPASAQRIAIVQAAYNGY